MSIATVTTAIALSLMAWGNPPSGEDCDTCIPILDGSYIGTTDDNTGELDSTSCTEGDTIDEWYCYTPAVTGWATAGLCGSSYDTAIAVFLDCSGANELACNDDLCGAIGQPALQSGVNWGATAGITYYIRISGYYHLTGNYLLYVNTSPIGQGPGYSCWNSRTATDGNTFGNTDQSPGINGGGSSCSFGDPYALWYRYQATCHGLVTADTCLSGFDTYLSVFDACDGTELACNDDGCPPTGSGSKVKWLAEVGEDYFLRVAGYGGGQGPFFLRLACQPCDGQTLGDLNADHYIDALDIAAFTAILLAPPSDPADLCAGDFNGDLAVTMADTDGFVQLLLQE